MNRRGLASTDDRRHEDGAEGEPEEVISGGEYPFSCDQHSPDSEQKKRERQEKLEVNASSGLADLRIEAPEDGQQAFGERGVGAVRVS
jgi:hypothetical protein